MTAITICSDFGAQKNKVWHCFHCFPIYFPCSDGTRCPGPMVFIFWMLSFKPTFSLSSFTFIKRLFSSSLLSAIRLLSSAYLRLLIFLLAILIPACASSSPVHLTLLGSKWGLWSSVKTVLCSVQIWGSGSIGVNVGCCFAYFLLLGIMYPHIPHGLSKSISHHPLRFLDLERTCSQNFMDAGQACKWCSGQVLGSSGSWRQRELS